MLSLTVLCLNYCDILSSTFSLLLLPMSILKYFHKIKWKDQERDQEDNFEIKLPDPDGDLSKAIPSKAIHAANESIEQLLEPKGVKRAP